MVAHQIAPTAQLEPIMEPERPPAAHKGYAGGFRRTADRQDWYLTPDGRAHSGVAQRMLLRYVLLGDSRADIAAAYGYSQRETQGIIGGERLGWLTLPVRRRLIANGIGDLRMTRSNQRAAEVRRALEKLAAQAVEYLRWPHLYTYDEKQQAADDLYLISGAWREDQP